MYIESPSVESDNRVKLTSRAEHYRSLYRDRGLIVTLDPSSVTMTLPFGAPFVSRDPYCIIDLSQCTDPHVNPDTDESFIIPHGFRCRLYVSGNYTDNATKSH